MAFKDPDARRAYDAEWKRAARAKDPEGSREKVRARYQANPEPTRERNAEWRAKNREHLAAAEAKRRRERPPEANRDYRLRRFYGITLLQFEEMSALQGGRCAICGREESPLSVDHCHDTGKVRGLLCKNCNKGLGMFGESAETIREALNYLELSQQNSQTKSA